MKNDILTVMWKERKGLFRVRGRRAQALLAMFSPVLLAVLFPLQEGVGWVQSPLSLLLAFIAPLILRHPRATPRNRQQFSEPRNVIMSREGRLRRG